MNPAEIGAAMAGLVIAAKWLSENNWFLPLLARIWRRVQWWMPGHKNGIFLRDILAELRPNGGSSLRDAVTRLERNLDDNTKMLRILRWKEKKFANTLGVATFETDSVGRCVDANETYLELVGLTIDEVLQDGWRNAIDKDELEDVCHDWDLCVAQGRDFHRTMVYVHYRTGLRKLVNVDAYVVHDHNPHDILWWIGYVEPVRRKVMNVDSSVKREP